MGAHTKESGLPDDAGYLDRVKRIKKEEARIKKLFGKIDEDRKKLVLTTIADVAFMTVTMQDLREVINREGTTAIYKNGENQYGTKQSPESQTYLQLSQKLTQAMKILVDCMPKPQRLEEPGDGFEDFVDGREDV
ncbi:MAG: hypothetical protein HFH92_08535 [Lachnospiraceae bacterium]|nr:hypothetical protein [uncultured Acetatifactor sp.]MCI8789139.1 hypothetical protein [Lachnospiraceae bacterium]